MPNWAPNWSACIPRPTPIWNSRFMAAPRPKACCSAPAMPWWRKSAPGSRKRSPLTSPSSNADAAHPFLSRHQQGFRYAGAWSCLMRGQGFHINHLHPEGWISSCYYVTVPEVTDNQETQKGLDQVRRTHTGGGAEESRSPRRATRARPAGAVSLIHVARHHSVSGQLARTTIAFDVRRNSGSFADRWIKRAH